jgi:endonuclease YncB( thermonuclease family)
MKASKFTDAQKAFFIKQGDEGTPVADICRKAGISQATYFNWKKKYAGLAVCRSRCVDLNCWLVSQGWAVAYRSYPRDYVRAEDQARATSRGVWSGQFDMPWEWRAARR